MLESGKERRLLCIYILTFDNHFDHSLNDYGINKASLYISIVSNTYNPARPWKMEEKIAELGFLF